MVLKEAVNCTITRISAGLYEVTFIEAMDNNFYTVACMSESITRFVSVSTSTKTETKFRISNTSSTAVYSDGGAILDFTVIGKRTV
jgi:hypothetical protein